MLFLQYQADKILIKIIQNYSRGKQKSFKRAVASLRNPVSLELGEDGCLVVRSRTIGRYGLAYPVQVVGRPRSLTRSPIRLLFNQIDNDITH
jgi:hypothetical protein